MRGQEEEGEQGQRPQELSQPDARQQEGCAPCSFTRLKTTGMRTRSPAARSVGATGDGGAGSGERGLKCSKGVFKDGVLYVKPPPGTTERQAAANTKKRSYWRKKPTKR